MLYISEWYDTNEINKNGGFGAWFTMYDNEQVKAESPFWST